MKNINWRQKGVIVIGLVAVIILLVIVISSGFACKGLGFSGSFLRGYRNDVDIEIGEKKGAGFADWFLKGSRNSIDTKDEGKKRAGFVDWLFKGYGNDLDIETGKKKGLGCLGEFWKDKGDSGIVAEAAVSVSPVYVLNGRYNYTYVTGYGSTSGTGSGSVVSYQGVDIVELRIRTDSTSGSQVISSGKMLNLTKYNIEARSINVKSHGSFVLKKSGNVMVNKSLSGSGSVVLYSGVLEDGSYDFEYKVSHAPNAHSIVNIEYFFDFKTDKSSPTNKLMASGNVISSGSKARGSVVYSATDSSGVKKIYYKRPGDSVYSTSVNTSYTIQDGSNDGAYYFYAEDNTGNSSEVVSVVIDNTIPVGKLHLSTGAQVSSGSKINAPFKYTSSDASGISACYIKKDNGTWNTYTQGTVISQGDGLYSFKSVDNVGNQSAVISLTYDTVKPTLTVKEGNNIVASGQEIKAPRITATAADSLSGLSKIECRKPGSTSYVTYTQGTELTTEGKYYFKATDNAGNVSSISEVLIDRSVPSIRVESNLRQLSAGEIVNTPYIKVAATDALSTEVKTYVKTPGSLNFQEFDIYTFAAEGTYIIKATDKAGNMSPEISVSVDRTSPSIRYKTSLGTWVDGITNSSIFAVSSDNMGLGKIWIKFPGSSSFSSHIVEEPIFQDGVYVYNSGIFSQDGTYICFAEDLALNKSNHMEIKVDKTRPTGKIINSQGDAITGNIVSKQFKFISSDENGIDRMEVKYPGSDYATYNGSYIYQGEDGIYSFIAIDRAGNISSTYSLTFDTSPPSIKILVNGLEKQDKYISSPHFEIVPQDSFSESKVYIKNNTDSYIEVSPGINSYEEGIYTIYAEDLVGNKTQEKQLIVDYTPPVHNFIIQVETSEIIQSNSPAMASEGMLNSWALTMEIYLGLGENGITNGSFEYCIKDAFSEIYQVWYKRPDAEEYVLLAPTEVIDYVNDEYYQEVWIKNINVALEGKHFFYAVDRAGNMSTPIYMEIDRTPPIGKIYVAGERETDNYFEVQTDKDIFAEKIKYISTEDNVKLEVKLPSSHEYVPYVNGAVLFEEGRYSFRCIDRAGNKSIEKHVSIDRTPAIPVIEGLIENNIVSTFFRVSVSENVDMFVNGVRVENSVKITAVPNGTYLIKTVDAAGNKWESSIIASYKAVEDKNAIKTWYEGQIEETYYSYSSYDNALEAMLDEEFNTVVLEEWKDKESWNSGIMRDLKDEPNARPGIFYIYKSEKDPLLTAAYFTAERLTEVAESYAKEKIKKYWYFEKAPANPAINQTIYLSLENTGYVATQMQIIKGITYTIDGMEYYLSEEGGVTAEDDKEYIENGAYIKEGMHSVQMTDKYGNSFSFEIKIVRSCPDIYIRSDSDVITNTNNSGYIKANDSVGKYYFSNLVTLTINENIEADALMIIEDFQGKVIKVAEKGELVNLEDIGRYYVKAINRFGESFRYQILISKNKATIENIEDIKGKKLDIQVRQSDESFATLTSIKIERSIDAGISFMPLTHDDYGKEINSNSKEYSFRTSGQYKITVSDPFRHGTDSISSVYTYKKPAPEGTLTGVKEGGVTNKNVVFSWTDEGKAHIKKDGGEYIEIAKDMTISEEGMYEIVLSDYDQNKVTYFFSIKKTPPSGVLVGVDNNGVTSAPVNLKVQESDVNIISTRDGKLFSYQIGTPLTQAGKYEIVLEDSAGNRNVYSFEIVKEKKNKSPIIWIIIVASVIAITALGIFIAKKSSFKFKKKVVKAKK